MTRLIILAIAAGFGGGAALSVALLGSQLADSVVYILAGVSLIILLAAVLILPSRSSHEHRQKSSALRPPTEPAIIRHTKSRKPDERLALKSSRNAVRDLGERVAPLGNDLRLPQALNQHKGKTKNN